MAKQTSSVPAKPDSHGAGTDAKDRLSVREAADAAGVSEATIRRRIKSGVIANARVDADGTWRIDPADLDAVRVAPRPAAPARPRTPSASVNAQVAQLQTDLAVQTAKREAAEKLAAERAATIDTLRSALALIQQEPVPTAATGVATGKALSDAKDDVQDRPRTKPEKGSEKRSGKKKDKPSKNTGDKGGEFVKSDLANQDGKKKNKSPKSKSTEETEDKNKDKKKAKSGKK